MVALIRTLLFNVVFYIGSLLIALLLLPTFLFPTKVVFAGITFYFKSVYFMEKYILGLDYKIIGEEHIPDGGSFIIASKHQSAYETLKLFILFDKPAIIYKKELQWIPLWGLYLIFSKMIPINRGKSRAALNSIITNSKDVVESGRPIAIFPQGTRTKPGEKKPYKSGFMRLYEHYNLPILPVALNSGCFWGKNSFLKKPGTVTFKILPLIPAGHDPKQVLQQLQEDIERESDLLAKEA